ncbi:MAG: hypothetical protein HYU67_11975 [Flavobacteriia bacterium]|nr:hypothetical protein [Flavobacteriia bacterium]
MGVLPKIGVKVNEGKIIFYELILGYALRYITSKSQGKNNQSNNLEKEYFTKKIFDDGDKLTHRFAFQVKVGFNF